MDTAVKRSNHGANVRRWREWRGIKQEVLAEQIGVSQATFSGYEKKDKLEQDILDKVSKALDIPVEAITEVGQDTSVNIFSGPWHDNSIGLNQIFNPVEKIISLYDEKIELYERMLKDKNALLEKILKEK